MYMYIYCFNCVSLKMKLRLNLIYIQFLAAYLFVCASIWVLYAIRCCLQVFDKTGDCCNYVIINTTIMHLLMSLSKIYDNGIVVLEIRMFMFLFSVLHINCAEDKIGVKCHVFKIRSLHFLSP